MKKYRTTTGAVVEHDPAYVACFPEGAYVEVPDDTPLTGPITDCCGGAELAEAPVKNSRKEKANA